MNEHLQTMNGNGKRQRGRPRKHVDLELVEKLAHIQCTYGEIAATLGVSVDTLQRNKDFAVVYKRGAEGGRKSLRRMQFESANRGSVVMQIYLGKVYLGQCENPKDVRPLPPEHMDPRRFRELFTSLPSSKLSEIIREFRDVLDDTVIEHDPLLKLPPASTNGRS
jgi:hypothetical protein